MDRSYSGNIILRCVWYCLALAGITGLSSFLIQIWGGKLVMQENGIAEWAQVGCLVFTAILIYLASRHTENYKELFRVLFILPIIAVIRENDNLLERYVFDEAWETFVIIGLIYMGYVLVKSYKPVCQQFLKFSHTQVFICFVLAFFIIFAFARIVGQQHLWRALLEEKHHRAIGGFIEEIMELFGYCILLIGALECYLNSKLKSGSNRSSQSNI